MHVRRARRSALLARAALAQHERPQRWIIQLARKRILALKRIVEQRQAEGDRAFIEGIEIMGFLATLVGLTSVRAIHSARHARNRTPRRAEPRSPSRAPRRPAPSRPTRTAPRRAPLARRGRAHRRTPAHRRDHAPDAGAAELEGAELLAAQRAGAPAAPKPRAAAASRPARDHQAEEGAVDHHPGGTRGDRRRRALVRLGQAVARARGHDRAARRAAGPSEIRRILRTYREQIDAVATRRRD